MKKLLILLFPILLFSSCASWHLGYIDKHLDVLCKKCVLKDSSSIVDVTIDKPGNELPDYNDSLLIDYLRNCNALANELQDSVYHKNQTIRTLADKIKLGQPNPAPLINPSQVTRTITIHDKTEVVNPLNIILEKENSVIKEDNSKKQAQIDKLKAVNKDLWLALGIIAGIVILFVIFRYFLKKA